MKTILLLEDEPSLLDLLGRVLMRRGYFIMEAALAEEAIRLFRDNGRRIDLLIADVTLPNISGVWVASLLRQEAPGLGVILTSGYPLDAWKDQDSSYLRRFEPGSIRILLKPFPSQTLLDAVSELIGEARAGVLSARV